MLFFTIEPVQLPDKFASIVDLIMTGRLSDIPREKFPVHAVCGIPAIMSNLRFVYTIVKVDNMTSYYVIMERGSSNTTLIDVLTEDQFNRLNRYSIRHNDEGCPNTIEHNVAVDHAEDLITVMPILLLERKDEILVDGKEGYVAYIGCTRPHLTIGQFADTYTEYPNLLHLLPIKTMDILFHSEEEANMMQRSLHDQLKDYPEFKDGRVSILRLEEVIRVFIYAGTENNISVTIPIT